MAARKTKTEPLDPETKPKPRPRIGVKGGKPGPGRPRGCCNKSTLAMRDAIAAVFEDLQKEHGGKGRYPHFRAWAKATPTEYYKMAVRLLPVQLETDGRAVGVIVFKGLNDDDDEE